MQMSVEAFLASSFGKEMENTELVLRHFDSQQVQSVLADWQQRIADNKHRVITFEGVQKV